MCAHRSDLPDSPSAPGAGSHAPVWLLKLGDGRRYSIDTREDPGTDDGDLQGIRCPLCGWQPARSSRWCCALGDMPEPPFEPCGTVWNTFDTGGRCPGCSHQWIWTTCLRCHGASLHVDWYIEESRRH